MAKKLFSLLLLSLLTFGCKEEQTELPDGLYAKIETDKGNITVILEHEKTPVTVANFVTLAEGKNEFVQDRFKGKRFYDGLTFHRVVQEFMIQGGDPEGNGSGGPGYKFMDEITDLQHNNPGTLSMANAGPGTNGSQFFITHVVTPFLDGKHTVFGHVIDGMSTVNSIAVGDVIKSITIIRNGEKAKKFDAIKIFRDYVDKERERLKKEEAINLEKQRIYNQTYKAVKEAKKAFFESTFADATKTPTGLKYKIIQKGSGKKPQPGADIFIHYAGYLEDGTLFDSSIEEVAKQYGKFDEQRKLQMGYQPILFQAGRKDGMIPGFLEGIDKLSYGDKAVIYIPASLGYGPQGAGGVIPPNANLIFEIELLK